MDVTVIAETIELLNDKRTLISERDREFILWFAFATGDRELTDKLTEELMEKDVNKQMIRQKYETVAGLQLDWIRKMEVLLVALEMYRIQEEKNIKTLTEILTAYGIDKIGKVTETDLEETQTISCATDGVASNEDDKEISYHEGEKQMHVKSR